MSETDSVKTVWLDDAAVMDITAIAFVLKTERKVFCYGVLKHLSRVIHI